MMGQTHAEGAAVAWLTVMAGATLYAGEPSPKVIVAGTAASAVGGLAVDIDHRSSEAANFLRTAGTLMVVAAGMALVAAAASHASSGPWVLIAAGGVLVAWLPALVRPDGGGYRGVLHSWWGVLVALLLALVPVWPLWAGAAFMCGWLSHLALDAATKEGLPLAWKPGVPRARQHRWGWLPKAHSMTTGGPRRKGHRRSRAGVEYRFVQPALAVTGIFAVWLLAMGGHP